MKEVSTLKSSKTSKAAPKSKLKKKAYYQEPLIAALLAGLCFVVLMMISSVAPFGNYTILLSDMEAQYAPFLFLFKRQVLNLDFSHLLSSLTYSTEMGMGKNMTGTFGYYLGSPVNLLVFFFKPSQATYLVSLIIAIKLMLASSFMCIFMHERSEDKLSKWPIVYGVMYAYSSYTMVFMFNYMWLDAYFLLPLILYFIEGYLKEKKYKGIVVTLLLLFIANFYVAYMAGIFSFVYMLVRMYELDMFKDKSAIKIIGKFVLVAVFCALTITVILAPVALDTLRNSDPTSSAALSQVRFKMIDLIDQIFLGCPGEFSEIMPSNPPFIFISILTTFACVIYFVSDVFKNSVRKLHAICFIFIYASLAITVVDTAWHVFDSPNWFYHRQTFVFMPFFLIITMKVMEKIREVSNKDIFKSLAILIGLLMVAQSFGDMKERDAVFLVNLLFLIALAFILAGFKVTKWPEQLKNMDRLLPFILALIIVSETSLIATVMSGGISTMSVHFGDDIDYRNSLLALEDAANAADTLHRGYRFENEQIYEGSDVDSATGNGAFWTGYNGISLFNSNSNKELHRYLKQLGYGVNYNYFAASYTYSALDTDAFLSIGALVSRTPYSGANYVMDDTYGSGFGFYYYDRALPIGFSVPYESREFDFYQLETMGENKNYFEFRNDWYSSMFPEEFADDYFVSFDADGFTLTNGIVLDMSQYVTTSVHYDSSSDSSTSVADPDGLGSEVAANSKLLNTIYRENSKLPIILEYTLTAPTTDEIYMNLVTNRVLNACEIYVNGRLYQSYPAMTFYSPVIRVGAYEAGEEVTVTIMGKADTFEYMDVYFAYLDSETFNANLNSIDTSDVEVLEYSNGYAAFNCNLANDDMLLTTIPYERGWRAYVDGTEVRVMSYQDALLAVNCGPGNHKVEFVFEAPGVKAGAAVSVVGICGLIAMGLMDTKKKKAKV